MKSGVLGGRVPTEAAANPPRARVSAGTPQDVPAGLLGPGVPLPDDRGREQAAEASVSKRGLGKRPDAPSGPCPSDERQRAPMSSSVVRPGQVIADRYLVERWLGQGG